MVSEITREKMRKAYLIRKERGALKDKEKDAKLRALGYKIIRLWEHDIKINNFNFN